MRERKDKKGRDRSHATRDRVPECLRFHMNQSCHTAAVHVYAILRFFFNFHDQVGQAVRDMGIAEDMCHLLEA